MLQQRERNGPQYFLTLKKSSCPAYVQLSRNLCVFFQMLPTTICLPGDPLAKSIHACLFSRFKQLPFAFGRHVGKRNKLSRIYMGELLLEANFIHTHSALVKRNTRHKERFDRYFFWSKMTSSLFWYCIDGQNRRPCIRVLL